MMCGCADVPVCQCANVRMCQCADPVKPGQVVRMLVARLGVLPFTADPGHQNEDAVVWIPFKRDKFYGCADVRICECADVTILTKRSLSGC
jgi:hypothetical protein